ncbi:MAG: anti-sigma factor family protein [Phycisphaerae bacterium]
MQRHEFEQKLADYLGQEMAPDARQAFEAYLNAHPEAQTEANALRAVLRGLDQLAPPPTADVAEAQRIVNPTGGPGVWRRSLAYAAVLIAGVAIGWTARPLQDASLGPAKVGTVERILRTTGGIAATVPQSRFARNCLALNLAFSQPIAPTLPAPPGSPSNP